MAGRKRQAASVPVPVVETADPASTAAASIIAAAPTSDPLVQLATRVPASLQHRLGIYCATKRLKVMHVVAAAVTAVLDAEGF